MESKREHDAIELLKAIRQILAEYESDGALQVEAQSIDRFLIGNPAKPRPLGAMAVIIKDTSLLAGTIGNNVAALMTKTIEAADDPGALGYNESAATCLMLAMFEVFGVPAHSKMPGPEIMQPVLNRMAVEFGFNEDLFTIKTWDVESKSDKPS